MYSMSRLSSALPRIVNSYGLRSFTSVTGPQYMRVTEPLLAEPMKRKKKMDPAILRRKEEKRRKKIQKEIRRLEKLSTAVAKTVEELEVPHHLIEQEKIRKRPPPAITDEEAEARVLLLKSWARNRRLVAVKDTESIQRMMLSQKQALAELRTVSEELYQQALTVDECLLPYRAKGPTDTPPKPGYYCPDGKYIDRTTVYEGDV